MTAFEEMGVLPEIAKAVDEMEWVLPTDVQAEAIPAILGGGDVLMAAETGSGKTGAFCLPVLQIVWESLKDLQQGKLKGPKGGSTKPQEFKSWQMNMYDRGHAMAITPDGLLCQSRDPQGWHGTRCTRGVSGKGKYYYEATVSDEGLCRLGWSTINASLDLGTDRQGFGYGGTGKKSFGKQFDDYGASFALGDTIGCYLDLDKMQIKYSKNETEFPKAFDIPKELHNAVFYPAVVLKNAEIQFNFGKIGFKFPPKEGYIAVCEAPDDCSVSSEIHGQRVQASAQPKPNEPFCVIIEPSRELAEQTYMQIEKFKKHLDNPVVRNLVVIGGVSAKEQIAALNQGVHIVTGTPGRLEEFISTGQLSLSQVRFFILDEADALLSQGYSDLINKTHAKIPKVTPEGKRLQMIVCSATLVNNFDVKKMAARLMHFPQWVDLKGQDSVPETVHHVVCLVDPKADKRWINPRSKIMTDAIHAKDQLRPGSDVPETLSEAVKILKGEYVLQAIREHKMDQCLIFCRTKIDCDNMEQWLQRCDKDFTCVCLHGDRRADERKHNLELFKAGKCRFLICTDVAARGIDIAGMPYVINVTLPDEKANYLHRIGRVGRAERMGLAISLVSCVPEKVWYHGCPSKGKNCYDTRLTDQGGCAIWYNEPQYLAEIEEHLGVTVQQVDPDLKVPLDEYDGKVRYGAKRQATGSGYQSHAGSLASSVQELHELERRAQTSFLNLAYKNVPVPS